MSTLSKDVSVVALDAAPVGIAVTNEQGVISWVNQTLYDWLGAEALTQAAKLVDGAGLGCIDTLEGGQRWLERVTAHHGDQTLYFFSDVSAWRLAEQERARLAEELALHITRDECTGLPNRRALLQGLELHVSRSRRYENPLTVVVFKLSSSAFAPDVAEATRKAAILSVAHLLRDQVRWVDLVGRTAEDEFMLVLPETTLENAQGLAEKIVARLAARSIADKIVKVHCCYGIAAWSKGDDTHRLVARAMDNCLTHSAVNNTGAASG